MGLNMKANLKHSEPLLCSAWKHDGTMIFAGDISGNIVAWDVKTG